MKLREPEITELILRQIQGKTSAAEDRLLDEWLTENPDNAGIRQDYQKIWKETEIKEPEFQPDVDAAWRKVSKKANLNGSPSRSMTVEKKSGSLNLVWRIAAAFVLLAGLGFVALQIFDKEAFIEVTAQNEKMEISLPDGSVVALNKNATIKYPENFQQEDRDVYLEGEAFFQVAKDPARPFKVYGAHSTTEVLGTSFKVKANRNSGVEEITVYTGKVSFSAQNGKEKVILVPGHSASCSKAGEIVKEEVKTENTLAWKTKELKFNDTRLGQIEKDLAEYFDRKVIISEHLKDERFTGSFQNPTLEEVLEVVSITTDAEVVTNDSIYFLKEKVVE